MASHNDLGVKGEQKARIFLEEKGYTVLCTNYRHRHLEIDIIARREDCLVVIEVKTRNSHYLTDPTEILSKTKQKNLIKCAQSYIEESEWDGDTRFDLMIIVSNKNELEVEHIEDAFYPL